MVPKRWLLSLVDRDLCSVPSGVTILSSSIRLRVFLNISVLNKERKALILVSSRSTIPLVVLTLRCLATWERPVKP